MKQFELSTQSQSDVIEPIVNKLSREVLALSSGVSEAVRETLSQPHQKVPELIVSAGFGVALQVLTKAGATGRVLSGAVSLGASGKMLYDEVTNQRWSTLGRAISDCWESSSGYDNAVWATKDSIGSMVVDAATGTLGFKLSASLRKPIPENSILSIMRKNSSQSLLQSELMTLAHSGKSLPKNTWR